MDQFLLVLQKWSMPVFLVSSMLATGLSMPARAAFAPMRNRPLVLLALALNFIAAPALSWLLAFCLRLSPGHSAGLILLGCAAGAPFLPKVVEVARGDLTLAAALLILLTAGTILFMPFALPLLAPAFPADPWAIAKPLLQLIVAPLAVGMIARSRMPRLAAGASVLAKIGNIALLIMFALLVGQNVTALFAVIGSGAILAAALHYLGLFGIAWWLGNQQTRAVLSLGTAARNFGAALVPAASSGNLDAMVMLVVCAIVGLVVAFSSAIWVKNRSVDSPAN